ncbi:MAG: SprT family zinc-dependent metalloprotease [Patescibacteria group bacterium]|jgi:predicted metal-dependent hydrolase|nr:SprT family zinc-dependent metalloprotease [Patescibacteria group bacterium]MDD3777931.1 SprT family zinc-dependent metalloprotease [Patescibacteria group bacterium]MDD3939084.1 SprT family zinc-dependent metalloprotease [Patescibacteria group bacterium]MDD4443613.1 SprT family zinc-dependent metalloprotease [Patescibacteria group bacterium]NCU39317.1 M48 family peptidase [Candidatus Falkowbacteria bacterium]
MIKNLFIANNFWRVEFKNIKRSLKLSLLVYKDGRIVVTKPYFVSLKKAEEFIKLREDWLKRQIENLEITNSLNQGEKKQALEKHYRLYKKQAGFIIKNKVEKINQYYGFKYKNISIRNQKTRWGSCSRSGNLNFNYRLAFLDERALEYVIAHELCHLKEFNHSANFWTLVSQVVPDYQKWRLYLKNSKVDNLEVF